MKKLIIFVFFMFSTSLSAAGVKYPRLPSFGKTSSSTAISSARSYRSVKPRSNGKVIKYNNSYAVVDNKEKPKCVFYLNYAKGNNVVQYAHVGYVNLRCR